MGLPAVRIQVGSKFIKGQQLRVDHEENALGCAVLQLHRIHAAKVSRSGHPTLEQTASAQNDSRS